ncbi:hypothetical protein F0919_00295 [Taibaiella lutea]|uniref:Uncharacterized protein n=1 Tax=Taibaiella lutea TaxID=2608001 RepID=A0A5M6CMB0_9BACT|nr:hypothetical protein [Taibaiella lutea]KAA5536146.1 hypothetical protein F0919_00295 [Taibaiella lutea]
MTTNANSVTSGQYLQLLLALQQCNLDGVSPTFDYQDWVAFLQAVYQQMGYTNTAADFVTAINQVWGSLVVGPTMLNVVTALTNSVGQQSFTAAVVQPLIDGLLATFLIRNTFSDTGGVHDGVHWVSPDIINYGTTTLTVAQAVSSMGSYINGTFTDGQSNNMYVRAQNIGPNAASGYVTLFAVPSSLLLTPQSWLPCQISQPSSLENFYDQGNLAQIQPGEVCLNTTAFNYSGSPGGGHFCLIALASGANGMPFPIPDNFPTNAGLAGWVLDNPNVAQRNMDYGAVSGTTGTMNATVGNNNDIATTFVVTLTPGPGNTFPAGTTVSASITDTRAPYAPPVQQWAAGGISFYNLVIPPNINGASDSPLINMTLTIQLPVGASFSGTSPILVTYYQVPTNQNDDLELALIRNIKLPDPAQLPQEVKIAARGAAIGNQVPQAMKVYVTDIFANEDEDGTPLLLLGACQFTFS